MKLFTQWSPCTGSVQFLRCEQRMTVTLQTRPALIWPAGGRYDVNVIAAFTDPVT